MIGARAFDEHVAAGERRSDDKTAGLDAIRNDSMRHAAERFNAVDSE